MIQIILGILAMIAIPTFQALIERSEIKAAKASVESVGRNAALASLEGDRSAWPAQLATSVAEADGVTHTAGADTTLGTTDDVLTFNGHAFTLTVTGSQVEAVSAGAAPPAAPVTYDVLAWGYNDAGQTDVPVGLTDVVDIAAGGSHSLALRSDGTVIAWGLNHLGQADVPVGLTDVVDIAAGGSHSLALLSDGTVVAWGWAEDLNTLGLSNCPDALPAVTAVVHRVPSGTIVDPRARCD